MMIYMHSGINFYDWRKDSNVPSHGRHPIRQTRTRRSFRATTMQVTPTCFYILLFLASNDGTKKSACFSRPSRPSMRALDRGGGFHEKSCRFHRRSRYFSPDCSQKGRQERQPEAEEHLSCR